jgi:hypothetical protein
VSEYRKSAEAISGLSPEQYRVTKKGAGRSRRQLERSPVETKEAGLRGMSAGGMPTLLEPSSGTFPAVKALQICLNLKILPGLHAMVMAVIVPAITPLEWEALVKPHWPGLLPNS